MEVFSRVEGGENVLERRVRVVKGEVGREGRRKPLERENMRCECVDSDQQHIRLHRGAEGSSAADSASAKNQSLNPNAALKVVFSTDGCV